MGEVGYVRVSTTDQATDRQLAELKLSKVFTDKLSGKDTKRPQLAACLEWVREGDTLHVHSIDRLARNLEDLQRLVRELTGKGVVVRFHKEGLTFKGDEDPMQKLMFQMMGAFAEFERALIRERQREGIAAAKAAGKHLGRKPTLTPEQAQAVKEAAAAGEEKASIARRFGISRQTIYRVLADPPS